MKARLLDLGTMRINGAILGRIILLQADDVEALRKLAPLLGKEVEIRPAPRKLPTAADVRGILKGED